MSEVNVNEITFKEMKDEILRCKNDPCIFAEKILGRKLMEFEKVLFTEALKTTTFPSLIDSICPVCGSHKQRKKIKGYHSGILFFDEFLVTKGE